MEIKGFIPDFILTGSLTVTPTTKLYPQSSTTSTKAAKTVTPTTEILRWTLNGRQRKYRIAQNEVDGSWKSGALQELIDGSTRQ